VSLSGYEEAAEEEDTTLDETVTAQGHDPYGTPTMRAGGNDTVSAADGRPISRYDDDFEGSSLLDSPSVKVASQETPRRQSSTSRNQHKSKQVPAEKASFADYPSPYEALKNEIAGDRQKTIKDGKDRKVTPTTPGRKHNTHSTTPIQPSPFVPQSQHTIPRSNPDPLLHRVLDKNYRIQATPHSSRKKQVTTSKPNTGNKNTPKIMTSNTAFDSSPFSPAAAAPQLRSDIFGSAARAPRTPGVSVQKRKTPRRGGNEYASARKTLFSTANKGTKKLHDLGWDSDSEVEDDLGISPPKTMQFHVPQSRLLRTPAKEASKRIVEDLLLTAGAASITDEMSELDVGGYDEDEEIQAGLEEDSPSVVRRAPGLGLEEDSPFGGD